MSNSQGMGAGEQARFLSHPHRRRLGQSSLEISPLVLGASVFSWTADTPMSFRLLDTALDMGINMVDTANVYTNWLRGHQGGESEKIIGAWLQHGGKRDRMMIATKVGLDMPEGKGLSAAHIRTSIDASLSRLRTDYVDLYQAHIDDESVPFEETLGAFAELIKEGKVLAIGTSNIKAARLREALNVAKRENLPRYESLQPPYNLLNRDFERELEPLCLSENIGVICYRPLARGFLSGKYRTEADLQQSARGGSIRQIFTTRSLKILQVLDEVAKAKNATQSAVALAWLMARPSITAPIVSISKPEQAADLISALQLDLDNESMQKLNEAGK